MLGNTWRVPDAITVPIPLLMETSSAPSTTQRRVEDWPRSIVEGSATRVAIVGAGTTLSSTGGGGGGGAGMRFLHPPAASNRARANKLNAMYRLVIFSNSPPDDLSTSAFGLPNSFILAHGSGRVQQVSEKTERQYYFTLHTGMRFRPLVVSCCTLVPSASMV